MPADLQSITLSKQVTCFISAMSKQFWRLQSVWTRPQSMTERRELLTGVTLDNLYYVSLSKFVLIHDFFFFKKWVFISTLPLIVQSRRNASNISAKKWWFLCVWWATWSSSAFFQTFVHWCCQQADVRCTATDKIRCERNAPLAKCFIRDFRIWTP